MRNGRLPRGSWSTTGSWLLFQSGRLLSGIGVGFAAIAPQGSAAARKNDRRDDNQAAKDDERRNTNETHENRQDSGQNDGKSDQGKNTDTTADTENSGHNADKRNRDQRHPQDDDGGKDESANASNRQDARRQESKAETSEDLDDSTAAGHGGSNGWLTELQQRVRDAPAADAPAADTPAPAPAPVAPANPNVVLGGVPDTTDVELVVQANPDVIASVSTSGGFAFARSGDVTAVTGPDGASIIRTGETGSGAAPDPREPSADGGNNDIAFTS